jgi:SET domain-containing protein
VVELTKDLYIDALPAGTESRLVNHSCRANYKTKLLYVNDVPRVGIFAVRSVRAGGEVTIDYSDAYRFEHSCLCGNCP